MSRFVRAPDAPIVAAKSSQSAVAHHAHVLGGTLHHRCGPDGLQVQARIPLTG